MKFMRRRAEYRLLDQRRNKDILEETGNTSTRKESGTV
jgi:hypothetical protein